MSLRSVNFFDRRVGPGFGSVTAACAAPDGTVWLGDESGVLRRIDSRFETTDSISASSEQILQISAAKQAIAVLGQQSDGSCKLSAYHLYRTDASGGTLLIGSVKIPADFHAVCIDASGDFSRIVVGCANGQTLVYPGGGLRAGVRPQVLVPDELVPVIAVRFLNLKKFAIITQKDLTEVVVGENGGLSVIGADTAGAASSGDLVTVLENNLLIARKATVFMYSSSQGGNIGAFPMDDSALTSKPIISLCGWSGHYFATSFVDRISICWHSASMRFVACEIPNMEDKRVFMVPGAFDGRGCLLVGDHESFMFRERSLQERVDALVDKKLFEWAIDLGKMEELDHGKICGIYREYCDWFFGKDQVDKAVSIAARAIMEGYSLEPSFVVNRLIENGEIEHVVVFLKLIRAKSENKTHTMLLLRCLKSLGREGEVAEVLAGVAGSTELVKILSEIPELVGVLSVDELVKSPDMVPLLELLLDTGNDKLFNDLMIALPPPELQEVLVRSPLVKLACIQSGIPSNVDDISLESHMQFASGSVSASPDSPSPSSLPLVLEIALRTKSNPKMLINSMIANNQSEQALAICKLLGAPAAAIAQIAKATPTLAIDAMAYPAVSIAELQDVIGGDLTSHVATGLDGGIAGEEVPLALVLANIEKESIRNSKRVDFGAVKNRLIREFTSLEQLISESITHAKNDDLEIVRMKNEITLLKRKPVMHALGKPCALCGLPVSSLPAVFFKCTHIYHGHCVPDSHCTVCALESKHHMNLLEQRSAAVNDHDALFKKMAGSAGARFDTAMAYLGHGLFC